MSSPPDPTPHPAYQDLDSTHVLRSLCHTVRGQLSRLHLRLELADLDPAIVAAMTADLRAIDEQLSNHRDLLQTPPQRAAAAVILWPLLSRMDAVQEAGMHLALDTSLQVWGWPEVVRLVLRPLLQNALEHGKAPWTIWAERQGNGVRLGIRDSGTGFDPELLATLQVPFQQVLPHRHGGAGLGLPLAAQAAAWLGASLHAQPCTGGFEMIVNFADPNSP